ncbi:hypothetical protein [Streptomyces sp. NPDC048411]|uniref:hypothetical protein n=1 Tax=Streptomyces sp. NPDC048411 TaxID=3157206 RepID=UPI0034552AF8
MGTTIARNPLDAGFQVRAGARQIPDWQRALEHELSDCLWSVLILARLHDVDLSAAFFRTMAELEESVGASIERARSSAEPA